MDFVGASTAGPVFSSSRIIRWSDLGDDEKDKFARFFAENNVAVSCTNNFVKFRFTFF